MKILYLVSVFIHILSAIVWVGGMVFLVAILVPVLKNYEDKSLFSKLFHLVGVKFRLIGWISLLLLIITGIFNLDFRGYDMVDLWNGTLFKGTFGHVLMQKLIAVAVILVISILHDFWIGPKATKLATEKPFSPEHMRYRKMASWIGRINFLLGLMAVAMGIVLVRGI